MLVNVLIIYKATKFSRSQVANLNAANNIQSERKKTQMTKMILFLTFLYIVLAMPEKISNGYFFDYIYGLDYGHMIVIIIDSIQFSYSSFQIFILFMSNKQFAKEVKEIVLRVKNNSMSSFFRSTNSGVISNPSARNNNIQVNVLYSNNKNF